LYEAAAETYLPLLSLLDEVHRRGAQPTLTLGLTPVLLEQLAHDRFKEGFLGYLAEQGDRAERDRKDFESKDELHFAHLATLWAEFYENLNKQFEAIGRDIPSAFAEWARQGFIEILTGYATHGYTPLLLEDSSIRAQIRAGKASTKRIMGIEPTGLWLPECAYRPAGEWHPAVSFGGSRDRMSVERMLADEGITHFFVEDPLVPQNVGEEKARQFYDQLPDDRKRFIHECGDWRPTVGPVGLRSDADGRTVAAYARCREVCEQVWSGWIGYPGTGVYLEFHKKYGERRGLRYWKVTQSQSGLGEKQPYHPDDIAGVVHEQAGHFTNLIRQTLEEHRNRYGRPGVVIASFDAELFGHWWFEGPRFLQDLLLNLHHDPAIQVCTVQDHLRDAPPEQFHRLPEFSWGEGSDNRVWINDRTWWMWEVEYRAEAKFGRNSFNMPWENRDELRALLERAGRELLLMQASDWPFVVARGQAIDYGIRRFALHDNRFEIVSNLLERVSQGGRITPLEEHQLRDADIHDSLFPEIDLNWWSM
jgi:1,4-alpha-glucan branching enzyme